MKNRNTNIDLIKSIACIMVVGLHSIGMTDYTFYYLCTYGVPLFFMVNGYLMFQKESISIKYSLRKVLSLLKIVFFWNIIILFPMMIIKKQFLNPLVYCLRSTLQKGYLWHFWFFGTMIILYALIPFIHRILYKRKFIHLSLCIILLLSTVVVTLMSVREQYPVANFVPQTLRLWTWLLFYLSGGFFSYLKLPNAERSQDSSSNSETPSFNKKASPFSSVASVNSSSENRIRAFIFSVLSIALIFITNLGQKHVGNYIFHLRNAEFFYDLIPVILCVIVLFYTLLIIPIPQTLGTFLSFFSSLSLGIFIVHPLILKIITSIITINKTATAFLLWLVTVLISFIISYVISKIPVIRELIRL